MIAVAAAGVASFTCILVALILGAAPNWVGRVTALPVGQPGNHGRPGRRRRRSLERRAVVGRATLRRARVSVSLTRFAGLSFGSGSAGATTAHLALGIPVLTLVAFGASAFVPVAVVQRRARAFEKARLASWPDALRDVIAHLRAGYSLHASLSRLADSGPLSLRAPFARYRNLTSAVDQVVALEVLREELADPASDRIIEVLLMAFEQGSSLVVELLADLAAGVAEDLRLAEEIQTAQLETRLEARGAAALPFGVLATLCLSSADYRAFYRTALGSVVIVVGLTMVGLGLAAIRRLGAMPLEERILGGGGQP